MQEQHLSISLKNFVGGERFNKVIVQVAAVGALLDVAVLGEILHPNSNVHHRFPAVLTVETGLRTYRTQVSKQEAQLRMQKGKYQHGGSLMTPGDISVTKSC